MRNVIVRVEDSVWCFLKNYKKEEQVKNQLIEFILKFQKNTESPGINFKKIEKANGTNYYSVRINQDYRGIIKKPDSGNDYLLVHVDKHDAAYKWAENHVSKIHPITGTIQTYEHIEITEELASPTLTTLFADISDRNLLKLSVPEELLKSVKLIRDQDELEKLESKLPYDAFEHLWFLSNGYSIDEILMDQESKQNQIVDTEDYVKALENPDTSATFRVIDDAELDAMMHEPLEKWRIFLHPSQRRLVERIWNGPVRVSGGAGTGKTIVALYRAKYLAENIFNQQHQRILFTTFTKNLAIDIKHQLKEICDEEAFSRIDVIHIDQWVKNFLQVKENRKLDIIYQVQDTYDWRFALKNINKHLSFDESFYWNEWELIVQAQEIQDLEGYLKASRTGRGIRLSENERVAIWPVFEKYRELQKSTKKLDWIEAMIHARQILLQSPEHIQYHAVIVDEVQDMTPQVLKLIRAMAGPERANDIFIVGDTYQRIYNRTVNLTQCNIHTIGRTRKLYINYRTTDEIRKWALALLNGLKIQDLDGNIDDHRGYRSLTIGQKPVIEIFNTSREEVSFIAELLRKMDREELKNCCIVAKSKHLIEELMKKLNAMKIKTHMITKEDKDDRSIEGIRMATMYRVKGLEFDKIIIYSVNSDVIPYSNSDEYTSEDKVIKEDYILREKSLLYVAATRAKKELIISCHGTPSPLLI